MSNDRKWFNIAKSIPLVGPFLKLSAATGCVVVNALEGKDWEETRDEIKSLGLGMDVANLNPIKAINSMVNTIAFETNKEEGVWLGKRPLGLSPISITFSPGFSTAHWSIMIEGTLYQICDKSNDGYCVIEITQCNSDIDSFTWNKLADSREIKKTKYEIYQKAKSFESCKYNVLVSKNKLNCQTFSIEMLQYACEFSDAIAVLRLTSVGGSTILF